MPRRLITIQFPLPPNPSDFLVVVPNNGAARTFDCPAVTLRTLATEALRNAGLNEATYLQTHFALLQAVASVCGSDQASSIATRYRPDLSATLRSGIDLNLLEKNSSGRVAKFARVARKYIEILGKQKAIDTEAVLTEARRCGKIRKQKVLVYGYFRGRPILSRPEEFEFIDAVAADESIFFLPDGEGYLFEENRKWIDELVRRGWQIDNDAIETPNAGIAIGSRLAAAFAAESVPDFDAAELESFSFASIEEEVRGVLSMAKAEILAGTPAEKIAIVCRKPEIYARLFSQTSAEYGVPVELDHRIPLAYTKVGSFVRLLLAANLVDEESESRFEFEDTLRLLFHSVLPRPSSDVWANARRTYPKGIEEWREVYPDVEKLILQTGERLPQEFAAELAVKIDSLGVRDQICASAEEMIALDRVLRLLSAYGRQSRPRAITFSRFTAEVSSLLSEITTDYSVSRGGVRLLLPNSAIGSFFDVVFAIGTAEGIHPVQPSETLTLNYLERKRLARHGVFFEDASAIPFWEDLTFCYLLFSARRKVVLSYPAAINDREQIPGFYFSRLGQKPKPFQISLIAGESDHLQFLLHTANGQPVGHPLFEHASRALEIERRRNSDAQYDEFDGVIGIRLDATQRGWSASRLTDFARCPFRWFARNCLRLKVIDEASTELDPLSRGSFYHKVLEIAGRRSLDSDDFREAMLQNLDDAFVEAEGDDETPISHLPDWELQRDEIRQTLENAIRSEAFIEPLTKVLDVEREFSFNLDGLNVYGRMDRIDSGPDGIAVVDYKIGGYVSKICEPKSGEQTDVQIPLYIEAIKRLYFHATTNSDARGRYYNLKKGKNIPQPKPGDLKVLIDHIKTEFDGGRFPVRPCVKTDVCKYCEFDAVCRRGLRLDLKRTNDPGE